MKGGGRHGIGVENQVNQPRTAPDSTDIQALALSKKISGGSAAGGTNDSDWPINRRRAQPWELRAL
jgi:hypothetical protein